MTLNEMLGITYMPAETVPAAKKSDAWTHETAEKIRAATSWPLPSTPAEPPKSSPELEFVRRRNAERREAQKAVVEATNRLRDDSYYYDPYKPWRPPVRHG